MDSRVQVILDKFNQLDQGQKVIMLDALYQWATAPTGITAVKDGYPPNHRLIQDNLKLRYGLADTQVQDIYNRLEMSIVAAGFNFDIDFLVAEDDLIQYFIHNSSLRDTVLERLKAAPLEEQYVTWLFLKNKDQFNTANFAALLDATFGIQIASFSKQVFDPLIRLGFLNRLEWVGSKYRYDRSKREIRLTFPKYAETLVANIDRYVSLPDLPDFRRFVDALFERKRVIALVGLEDLINGSKPPGCEGIIDISEVVGNTIPQPYLIGKCGSVLAINHRIYGDIRSYFFERKSAVPKNQVSIQQAIGQLYEEYYPDISFHPRELFPGTFAWEMHTSDKTLSEKDILIILAPWLTKNQIEDLHKESSSKFIAIVSSMMGIPELNDAFRKIYRTDIQGVDWVVIDTTRTPLVERAAAAKPRLLNELLNKLSLRQNEENEPAKLVSKDHKQGAREVPEPLMPVGPAIRPVEPSPITGLQITFPTYAEGASLVFGRGLLTNKIAWGFEVDKPLSMETIVTSDLHDINQPHVGAFQQTRTGKSTLASCICLQVAFQGIPVVIFDPKPDYVSNILPILKTIENHTEHRKAIQKRFAQAQQDIRGFDFTRELRFKQKDERGEISNRRILFQIYSFDSDTQQLPNCQALKLPLLVLPPLEDADFSDQCNAAATGLARCLPSRITAANTTLADMMKNFKNRNPNREFLFKEDVDQELDSISIDGRKKKKLKEALNDYYTSNSYLFASNENQISNVDSLVQNPFCADGDRETVSISVIDLSALPQDKTNLMTNYVSQVCSQLYKLVRRKQISKPTKLFVVFDEAQNYLPDPSEPFNYARILINRGASLGIKAWLMAQSPQAVEKEARKQFTTLVLSKVNQAAVIDEVSKYVHDDSWKTKLKKTELGTALIITSETGKEGGKLCNLFTTPQTVNLLSPKQILQLIK